MFNVTVNKSAYKQLKRQLDGLGVQVQIEDTFRDRGVVIYEVAVGQDSDRYSKRVARIAYKYAV